MAGWRDTLCQAADLGAEHLSPYQLTIEPGTAFDRAVRRGALRPADPDLAADLFEATQAQLEALGFDAYEVSNHARTPGARARHNLVYWRGWDYVGAGPGAHGRLTLDGARIATVAHAAPAAYADSVRRTGLGFAERTPLTPREAAEERLLMGLRTREGVALAEVAALGLSIEHARVCEHVEAGRLVVQDGRLRATPAGRRVLDALITQLAG